MKYLPILCLAAPFFFASCEQRQPSAPARPNIIFIMTDDHTSRAMSCYGGDLLQTPNIDRIAREGVLFSNSFVTNSICGPARAVLLTGKYSHLNGFRQNGDVFDGAQSTFPKLLQQTGYQTFVMGKWHLGSLPTGFDKYSVLVDQGPYYNPDLIVDGDTAKFMGYTTDIITDQALQSLNQRDPNKPFCLLFHHKAPHRNWMPDTKHLGIFKGKKFPLPESFYDDYATRSDAARLQDMRIEDMFLSYDLKMMPGDYEKDDNTGGMKSSNPEQWWANDLARLTPEQRSAWDAYYAPIRQDFREKKRTDQELLEWKYQRYMEDYLSCVVSVDENIGRLLAYLDSTGLAQNTIVVYTSDQGFYTGEHGWYDKRFMYEPSLRMPLVARYPAGVKAGQTCDAMALNLDFAPTFLDYAGVPIPAEMQGRSLRTLLEGPPPADWRKELFYQYFEYPGAHQVRKHYGIRTERYKLIHYFPELDAWELYDLQNDPNELKNLYADPAQQALIAELKARLVALRKQYQVPAG